MVGGSGRDELDDFRAGRRAIHDGVVEGFVSFHHVVKMLTNEKMVEIG